MAIYRQIHISFWQDNFVLTLTPEEKFFYLYLMTNSKTSQCGVYEIKESVMILETGYNRETINKLINKFVRFGKIEYSKRTEEIFLTNWLKYNSCRSPKVQKRVIDEVKLIKSDDFRKKFDRLWIDYTRSMDTVLQPEPEEEPTETPEEKLDKLINYWNAILKETARLLETQFISELFEKFGFDKTKLLIRQFREGNFHSLKTMREALNTDGTIKPRPSNGTPEPEKQYKTTEQLKQDLYGKR